MNIPLPKLKAILLYFGTYTDLKFLGKVKLMKLFYFLDFMHVKKYGLPVTNDNYVNLEHGPIPTTILNLINSAADDLDNSVLADTISFERPNGINMCRVIPARKFTENDRKYFSPSELDILERVCQRFGDKNTKFIEDISHQEAPWRETDLLEEIPYLLAAHDQDCQTTEDEIKLLSEI